VTIDTGVHDTAGHQNDAISFQGNLAATGLTQLTVKTGPATIALIPRH